MGWREQDMMLDQIVSWGYYWLTNHEKVLMEQRTDLDMLEITSVFSSWVVQGCLAFGTVVLWERGVSDCGIAKFATKDRLTKTRAVLPTQQFFGHGVKCKEYPGLVDRWVYFPVEKLFLAR
jgi:hypothetical protein